MVDDRRAMYDGFSDKGVHSTEWVWIIKEFLKVAFAGGHHEASYPCSMYENKRMLSKYEMFVHLDKNGFMSNYMVWHQHREVQPLVADVSDGNDDEDRMDDMIVDIGRGYVLESVDPQLEVHNFYRLIIALEEKMHDGTDVTVVQVVTRLMMMKSKYNFSNQCYNDIVKLIINLILVKHNMSKDLYQSKKIVPGLGMNYENIDAFKKIACCSRRSTRTTPNVCITVDPDT
jgi:hypothetical protein